MVNGREDTSITYAIDQQRRFHARLSLSCMTYPIDALLVVVVDTTRMSSSTATVALTDFLPLACVNVGYARPTQNSNRFVLFPIDSENQ